MAAARQLPEEQQAKALRKFKQSRGHVHIFVGDDAESQRRTAGRCQRQLCLEQTRLI